MMPTPIFQVVSNMAAGASMIRTVAPAQSTVASQNPSVKIDGYLLEEMPGVLWKGLKGGARTAADYLKEKAGEFWNPTPRPTPRIVPDRCAGYRLEELLGMGLDLLRGQPVQVTCSVIREGKLSGI